MSDHETALPVLGISHVAFTVTDMEPAASFWTGAMGFETVIENPRFSLLVHRGMNLGVGITDHDATAAGPFDERRVGLDHLAFAVGDADSLRAWEQRLTGLGIPHSGITESDDGHHLNLRAPDNVAIELYVMSESFLAAIGTGGPADPVGPPSR